MKPNFYLKIKRIHIHISGGWYSGESFVLFSFSIFNKWSLAHGWDILSLQIAKLMLTIAWN